MYKRAYKNNNPDPNPKHKIQKKDPISFCSPLYCSIVNNKIKKFNKPSDATI